MSALWDITQIETRKAWRSRVPLFIAIGFGMIPLATGFLVFIGKNPALSRSLGLISTKANLVGIPADWPAYLGMVAQAVATGGFILFSLVLTWVFGREFADGTAKDLLAVPVSRASIVTGKFLVAAGWFLAFSAIDLLLCLLAGAWVGLPPAPASTFLAGCLRVGGVALLVLPVSLPVAFFAGVGHGYLLAFGAAILLMILGMLAAIAGWGEVFPWSVPALAAEITPGAGVGLAGVMAAILTGAAAVAATLAWWTYADQNR